LLIPRDTNLRDQGVGGSNPLSPTNLSLSIPSEREPLHFDCLMPIAGKAGVQSCAAA
jgi:hypothetical protein